MSFTTNHYRHYVRCAQADAAHAREWLDRRIANGAPVSELRDDQEYVARMYEKARLLMLDMEFIASRGVFRSIRTPIFYSV